jgi:hypothetical protein
MKIRTQKAIAVLQYQLAELAGTGQLTPKENDHPQWGGASQPGNSCTTTPARPCVTSARRLGRGRGRQHLQRRPPGDDPGGIEPFESSDCNWLYNGYLCGDVPFRSIPGDGLPHPHTIGAAIRPARRGSVTKMLRPTSGRLSPPRPTRCGCSSSGPGLWTPTSR